jgi:hypothetical protein
MWPARCESILQPSRTGRRPSDVSRDIFRKAHRPLVVAALLEPRQIAELPPRGALCVDVAQSVTSVVARQRVDMEKEKGRVSLSATRP